MPKMTRSHYNLIADTVASIRDKMDELVHNDLCKRMADALAGTNSQFKSDRFRMRCMGIRRGR